MTPYNEREVLKLLQEESTQRKGFELIVAQYSEQLYWQIRRMVLSHEDANDLLQNTFIKAWTNIDYFRAEAKLSTWLYRIALNECLTFLNRQRATTMVAIDDPEAVVVQKLESDPYYSGDQVQMLLQKALLTLPEKQRMVFNLKYYQEMKYEDMSEIFGTSVGALKASYHHAVKKIEKFLEEVLKQTLSNQKRGEKRMKEEDTLLKKIGKEHSFKVPDGYFENLTSEVMNKLPEKEKVVFKEEPVSTWTRLKPLFYMAAMFVGAALIIRVASSDHKPAADDITVAVTAMETDTEQVSDEMIDVALDRAMLDDYSLYVYLSDASVE